MVECTRDALNLVLMTFEVAADGDEGISDGFAPALLQAIRSVEAERSRRFQLELVQAPHERSVGGELTQCTVQLASGD